MKKVIVLFLAVCLLLGTTVSLSSCSNAKFKIGICQIVKHDALDAATKGFKDAVTAALGNDVEFDEQDAAGDSAQCATIINSFVSKKVDLILANATPVLQAAQNATKTIPVLGTSITEYSVALDLKNYNGTVGGNISGTSDLAPLDQQAQMLLDVFPGTKKVGLLYCSAEPNSLYQVQKINEFLSAKGVECTSYPFTDTNDLSGVVTKAVSTVDVIYCPTDNTVASNCSIIDNIARKAKVPVYAGEEAICKGCGAVTLSINYYDLGYKTGEMAVKILRDKANISTMPIEYAPKVTKKYNKTICDDLGITVPSDYIPVE